MNGHWKQRWLWSCVVSARPLTTAVLCCAARSMPMAPLHPRRLEGYPAASADDPRCGCASSPVPRCGRALRPFARRSSQLCCISADPCCARDRSGPVRRQAVPDARTPRNVAAGPSPDGDRGYLRVRRYGGCGGPVADEYMADLWKFDICRHRARAAHTMPRVAHGHPCVNPSRDSMGGAA
jgi:hypothetical protein